MGSVNDDTQGESGGQGETKPAAKSSSRPRVVPLPLKREVSDKHLANLRASGLTDETIELAELYTEWNHKALADLVQRRVWPRLCGAALVFPFYLPGSGVLFAVRVRPTNPRIENRGKKKRPVKYDQAESYGVLVYFTPRARAGGWYSDVTRTLVWTEGEKKALVLDQLGHACVGLTGVWNWGDAQHRHSTGEERLHPALRDHVVIAGRRHVICFDADARDKSDVMLAASRLCGQLLAAGALSVRFTCPSSPEHKGIDDFFAAFGAELVNQLLEAAGELEPADPKSPLQRVRKVRALEDAPVSSELRIPDGYEVQKDGALWKLGDDKQGDVKVASSALLIQRHLDDYYTQDGRVDVCFDRDDRWVSVCVQRRAVADSRTMIADLAPYGAPVTSNNAAKLVDWLEDFQRVNSGRIARSACVGRAGWHDIDGERVFVLNEPLYADPERDHRDLALDTRGDRRKLFAALMPRGEAEAHLALLKQAWSADPVAAAVIAGALAAPLLEPLGAPNFAIHLPGESSRGKTTMLKIAASVYGDPQNDQWVASWNSTGVAVELRAAVLTDLPQCYDEVGASDPQQIERLVYMLVNGGGRSRSRADLSLRETLSWRTIVLSTGERELAAETTATGAQIRVLTLPVLGFGNLEAAAVDALRDGCVANAGAFGRLWIETLLGIEDWEPMRASLREATRVLRDQAPTPLEGRVAAFFAVLAVAEALASQLGLGEPGGGTMRRLFRDQWRREVVQGLAERALSLVRDWVISEPESFPELQLDSFGDERPTRTGSKQLHGFRRGQQVLFIPAQFRAFCERERLSKREVLREWQKRGWLEHDSGRLEKSVRVPRPERFYALNLEDCVGADT